MRLLCLHGRGTSAAIFKSQTAAFRAKLDGSFHFDFVDGPYPSSPAPGITAVFNSDHYAWWPKLSISLIRGAHKWLLDYIEENGPYDALCCFSQGCSLAISFLLYHARETPDAPLPFKSVVFICGGLPLPVLTDLGISVPQKAFDISDATSNLLQKTTGRLSYLAANPREVRPGLGLWDYEVDLIHDPNVMPNKTDVFGLDFTTFPDDMHVKIPTVHIYGAKDPRWPSSIQLAFFCNDRKMYDHRGGHDVPRSTEVSNRIAQLIRDLDHDVRRMN